MDLIVNFDVRQIEKEHINSISVLCAKYTQRNNNSFLSWLNAVVDMKELDEKMENKVVAMKKMQKERYKRDALLKKAKIELEKSKAEVRSLVESIHYTKERIDSLKTKIETSSEKLKQKTSSIHCLSQIELAIEKPIKQLKSPKRYEKEPNLIETNRDKSNESNIDTGGRISSTPRTTNKPLRKTEDNCTCKCNCF